MIALALDQDDWLPARSLEAAVDSLNLFIHASMKVFIRGNSRTARRGNLREGEALPPPRMLLDQVFHGQQPLHNPFRVIQPIDADSKALGSHAKLAQQLIA